MSATEEAAFAELARRIARNAGVSLEAYKDKCVRRRIAVRMRACGVHTYADYQALLERTPREYERLRDALTINVTRFFRNAEDVFAPGPFSCRGKAGHPGYETGQDQTGNDRRQPEDCIA